MIPDKGKRKARKIAAKAKVLDSYKKADGKLKENNAAELQKEKALYESAKENIKKTGLSGYSKGHASGERTPSQQSYDRHRAAEATAMVGSGVTNAMVGQRVKTAPVQLDSGTKKQVKQGLRKAVKNKNRSTQAVQSDKKRVKSYSSGR
jgi:hypothetical protein